MSINGALAPAAAVVAVDVGKTMAAVLVTDAQRHRLLGPLEFLDDRRRCGQVITKVAGGAAGRGDPGRGGGGGPLPPAAG